jgi:nucleotide-binding universal stress UspA family protein
MLLGSVAMKVLHDVECPIWMQTTKLEGTLEINGIKTIICPIELTGETVPLLHYAGEVAATLGARVRLVHVIPEQDVRAYKYFDGDFHQRLRDTALEEIARKQKEAGTDFPVTITKGNIASDVAELALDQNAELILTGRGKARSMFGSLRTHVTDIIREAPCPVLSYSMDWLAREFHPALSEPVTAHLPVVSLA